VDFNDLAIVLTDYGTTYGYASAGAMKAVPEPAGVVRSCPNSETGFA
jgi:hypothetical protein